MKSLVIVLVLLTSYNIKAAGLEVHELDHGACWLYGSEYNYKVASFNQNEAWYLTPQVVMEGMENAVESIHQEFSPEVNLEESKVDITFHCGESTYLVFNIHGSDENFCLWYKVNSSGPELASIGLNETNKLGYCHGYKSRELLITLNSNTDDQERALYELTEGKFKDVVGGIESVYGNTYKVILAEEALFEEKEILSELKKSNLFKYVELNFYVHSIGEGVSIGKPVSLIQH